MMSGISRSMKEANSSNLIHIFLYSFQKEKFESSVSTKGQ